MCCILANETSVMGKTGPYWPPKLFHQNPTDQEKKMKQPQCFPTYMTRQKTSDNGVQNKTNKHYNAFITYYIATFPVYYAL